MAEPKAAGAKPADSAEQQDPSMEEILQSIRRIIAEEEKQPGADGSINSDVLELTEMAPDDGGDGFGEEAATTSSGEPVDVLASIDDALGGAAAAALDQEIPTSAPEAAVPAPEAPVEPAPVVAAPTPAVPASVASDVDSLLSDTAAAASMASLKKLNSPKPQSVSQGTASPVFRSGETVEDLVLEALRPMLKDWLDNNLPTIVERIVEREVKKLASN